MAKRFEVYEIEGEKEPFHFQFVADNGEPVFESEGYASEQMAEKGIEAARECRDAEIVYLEKKSAPLAAEHEDRMSTEDVKDVFG